MLDDDKEVSPMKNVVAYRKSLRYDKDQSVVAVRSSRMGKVDKVDKRRAKVFALSQANVGTRARQTVSKQIPVAVLFKISLRRIIEIRLQRQYNNPSLANPSSNENS